MTPVTFILGCTACGKASVGQEIARRIGAQIVSVDSMKVYRRMDIGTAKPSQAVRKEIPHHCVDVAEPAEGFSVADYVQQADAAIEAVHAAGATALAVGGTNLYIKALSEGLFEGPSADPQVRQALKARAAAEGTPALHQELTSIDPEAASRIHPNDERRIVRALEVHKLTGQPISQLQSQWDQGGHRYECTFVGLRRDKDNLNRRINARVRRMMEAGLISEVEALLAEPGGLSTQAAAAVGYAELINHLHGEWTLDHAVERIKINTRHLAKNQRTWQRRFADVHWFDVAEDDAAGALADRVLAAIPFD